MQWPSRPAQQNLATFFVVTLGTALFTTAASFLMKNVGMIKNETTKSKSQTSRSGNDNNNNKTGKKEQEEEKKTESDSYAKMPAFLTAAPEPDPILLELFQAAADDGKRLTNITNTERLILYSLYKQSSVGDAPQTSSMAMMFNFVEKAKLSSWQKLRGMTKIQAMMRYMDAVHQLKNKKASADDDDDDMDDMPIGGGFGNKPSMMGELGMDDNDNRGEMTREQQLLHAASRNDCAEIQKLLGGDVESAVDVNHRDEDGQTALHLAADKGSTDAMKVLLQAAGGTVDVNAADADGISVLQAAVIGENVEACELLLAAGADPDKPDIDGDTPRSCAYEDGSDELRALFEQYSVPQFSEVDSTATGVTSATTATPASPTSPKEEVVA